MYSTLKLFAFLTLILSSTITYQNANAEIRSQNNERPRVYMDCEWCDYDHIRREVTFVNYVRDQEQADIHAFITAEGTGGGGRLYELSFIGRNEFSDLQLEFEHRTDRNMTDDEIRDSLNEAIRKGLFPYMMRTPYASRFSVSYDDLGEEFIEIEEEEDPWNYWVFEVYAGSIQFQDETNRTQFDSRWGFYADRVTEEWNLRFRPYFNYDFTEIEREEEENFINRQHRHGIDSYAIKSLTDHWSAALFADYVTRNDRNLEHRFRINPGIEYSLFPYQEATRRAITATYQIGYTHADYYERTIFDTTTDDLLNHELQLRAEYQQPWGSINAGITGSHYFHDFELRSVETFGRLSIRLAEGLNLAFQMDYDLVEDQISLRVGDADLEDVLLDRQELATDYYLRGLIAISYTFGSDFANIVNTRF